MIRQRKFAKRDRARTTAYLCLCGLYLKATNRKGHYCEKCG
jgi:hypothetical protein